MRYKSNGIADGGTCSQVLVVRWSLYVFYVLLLWHFNTKIFELLVRDGIISIESSSGSSPMPSESTHILESAHFFVSQVGDDLQHVTSISVSTEHIIIDQFFSERHLLEEQGSEDESSNKPFGVEAVLPEKFFHFNKLYINN